MKLRETPMGTWHRLVAHPDRLDKGGPTAFYVSWYRNTQGVIDVETRDHLTPCPSFLVTGAQRQWEYLNTDIVPEDKS